MKPDIVRPIVICVFRRGDDIFVFEGHDRVKKQTFYRPLGGQIEFGEYSLDALRRELREELNTEIENIRYMGVLENIFHFEGVKGHEVVFVYEVDFIDRKYYEQEWVTGYEDNGDPFKALWKGLDFFRDSRAPLYPDGLLELIE
jgi:8-oxo-dGTP pyrophosphatase MutT (NUDIX family)